MKRANLTATDTPMNPFALPAEAVADEIEIVEGGAQ
jgi:hypothetical protein